MHYSYELIKYSHLDALLTYITHSLYFYFLFLMNRGLVLCYKSEGRWFDPRWCHWIFH